MSKGFIESTQTIYRDENGIERVQTDSKTFRYNTEEDSFYMVFVDFVKWMYGIKSVNTLRVLPILLELAEFNTGQINITAGDRQNIMAALDINASTFTRAIKDLIDNKVLFELTNKLVNKDTGEITEIKLKGNYQINPEMFWKGELSKRKALKVTFTAEYDNSKDVIE